MRRFLASFGLVLAFISLSAPAEARLWLGDLIMPGGDTVAIGNGSDTIILRHDEIDVTGITIQNLGTASADSDAISRGDGDSRYLQVAGDSATGPVSVPAPTNDTHAANKKYVDDNAGGGGTGDVSSGTTFDTDHVAYVSGSDTISTDTGLPYDPTGDTLGVADGSDTTIYVGDGSGLVGVSGDTDITIFDSGTNEGDFGTLDFNSNLTVTRNGDSVIIDASGGGGGSGNLSSGSTFNIGQMVVVTGSDTVSSDTAIAYDTATNTLGGNTGSDSLTIKAESIINKTDENNSLVIDRSLTSGLTKSWAWHAADESGDGKEFLIFRDIAAGSNQGRFKIRSGVSGADPTNGPVTIDSDGSLLHEGGRFTIADGTDINNLSINDDANDTLKVDRTANGSISSVFSFHIGGEGTTGAINFRAEDPSAGTFDSRFRIDGADAYSGGPIIVDSTGNLDINGGNLNTVGTLQLDDSASDGNNWTAKENVSGNLEIGDGTSDDRFIIVPGTPSLYFFEGALRLEENSSAPDTGTNRAFVYGKNGTDGTEVFAKDESGNETEISAHDREGFYWANHYSAPRDQQVQIHIERMARFLERAHGVDFVTEQDGKNKPESPPSGLAQNTGWMQRQITYLWLAIAFLSFSNLYLLWRQRT